MDIIQELKARDDVYDTIHEHHEYATVMDCLVIQDRYLCVARKPTTYDLRVMQQFHDSFDGYEKVSDFAAYGSKLQFGRLKKTVYTRTTVAELIADDVEVRGAFRLNDEQRRQERCFVQQYTIHLMPCWRLLGRHQANKKYQPPHRTGRHPMDLLVMTFRVH